MGQDFNAQNDFIDGVFAIGVVDPPVLVSQLRCRIRICAHAASSPEPSEQKMYQVHQMQLEDW